MLSAEETKNKIIINKNTQRQLTSLEAQAKEDSGLRVKPQKQSTVKGVNNRMFVGALEYDE